MASRNDALVTYPIAGGGQSVAYTGTAGTISNPVGSQTYVVLIVVTTDAYIQIAKSPTATSSDTLITANTPLMFRIRPGEKVSAIQLSSGGTMYVSELTY